MNVPYEIINNIITYQYPKYPYLNEIKEKVFISNILSIEYLFFENYEDIQIKTFLFLNFGKKEVINELSSFWIF